MDPSDNFVGAGRMNYAFPIEESDGKQQRALSADTGFILALESGGWMCGLRWKVRPSISPSIMILRVGFTARSVNGNTVATIMPPEELGGI